MGSTPSKHVTQDAGGKPHDGASRSGITLLELLAVVIILAIIWAFVFPGTDAIRRSTRRREALTEVQSIATALMLYHDTYGRWPLQNQADDLEQDIVYGTNITVVGAAQLDQADLIAALTPARGGTSHPDNPRGMAFLQTDTGQLVNGTLVDPWNVKDRPSPYVIAVDANGDGWIGVRQQGSTNVNFITVSTTVGNWEHRIPALPEPVYVFSWSDTAVESNRVSTARTN